MVTITVELDEKKLSQLSDKLNTLLSRPAFALLMQDLVKASEPTVSVRPPKRSRRRARRPRKDGRRVRTVG